MGIMELIYDAREVYEFLSLGSFQKPLPPPEVLQRKSRTHASIL
jgi:hypothetical protein